MDLPKFDETFIPILKTLSSAKRALSRGELIELTIDNFYSNLPQTLKDKTYQKTNVNVLRDRIGWGLSYLKKGKFVTQPKPRYWEITKKGEELQSKNPTFLLKDLEKDSDYIQHRPERRKKTNKKNTNENNFDIFNKYTPKELIDLVFSELENELKEELLEKLKKSNPYYFEKIVNQLFQKMGYGDFVTTKKSGDGGIDGIINQDSLGIQKIYIQAKRYTNSNVREKELRDFKGALDNGKVSSGIFVTTANFDEKARESAKNSRNKIILINGKKLVELMIRYNLGVQNREIYSIKEVDSDFWEEE